jgi:hypothetical protein
MFCRPYANSPRTSVGLLTFLIALLASVSARSQPRPPLSPGQISVLRPSGGLPAEICGTFRDAIAFQQTDGGVYYVFDKRAHAVFSVDPAGRASRKVVDIGGEAGRLLEPIAFDLAPDGTFVVADAPNGRERLQVFDFAGIWKTGFMLPGRATARVSVGGLTLNGIGTLAFLRDGVALNLPETGALITEYGLTGTPVRSIGQLRSTGYENDRELHLALNAGIPIPAADGGYYFVFLAGVPSFRRYDAKGDLLLERVIQGRELDPVIAAMPKKWPTRTVDGTESPFVVPTVRAAAVDGAGNLWVSFLIPFTYVFDAFGEKVRTVQFRAAGIVSPTSLFFTRQNLLLITPGCFEFSTN